VVINPGDDCEAIVRSDYDCVYRTERRIRARSARFPRWTGPKDSLAEASSWAARTLLPRAALIVVLARPDYKTAARNL